MCYNFNVVDSDKSGFRAKIIPDAVLKSTQIANVVVHFSLEIIYTYSIRQVICAVAELRIDDGERLKR